MSDETIHIITTSDGSHSLIQTHLDETYHSRHGAVQESRHVFIQEGLHHWLKSYPQQEINILEIGFGTGLNALLTWQEAMNKNLKVSYTTLEAFPVPLELVKQLNYATQLGLDEKIFHRLHEAPWNTAAEIQPGFRLHKLNGTLQEAQFAENYFDLIYFDAFAPNKQPEMWELPMLMKTTDTLKAGGIFVTYCAKGQLKRDLKTLGLTVESLPGPPGKREMVRGVR